MLKLVKKYRESFDVKILRNTAQTMPSKTDQTAQMGPVKKILFCSGRLWLTDLRQKEIYTKFIYSGHRVWRWGF